MQYYTMYMYKNMYMNKYMCTEYLQSVSAEEKEVRH